VTYVNEHADSLPRDAAGALAADAGLSPRLARFHGLAGEPRGAFDGEGHWWEAALEAALADTQAFQALYGTDPRHPTVSEKPARYVKVLRALAKRPADAHVEYLRGEIARLGRIVGSASVSALKRDELRLRRNVLQAMLPREAGASAVLGGGEHDSEQAVEVVVEASA